MLEDAKELLSAGLIDQAEYDLIAKADKLVTQTGDTAEAAETRWRVGTEPRLESLPCKDVLGKRPQYLQGGLAKQHIDTCPTLNYVGGHRRSQTTRLRDKSPETNDGRSSTSSSWIGQGINRIRQTWLRKDHVSSNEQIAGEHRCKRRRLLRPSASPAKDLLTVASDCEQEDAANILATSKSNPMILHHEHIEQISILRSALPCLALMPTQILLHMVVNGRGCSKEGYYAGEIIVEKGDAQQAAFVVLHGEVKVEALSRSEQQPYVNGRAGFVVGCSALLAGATQTTTVVASTDVTVLVVSIKICVPLHITMHATGAQREAETVPSFVNAAGHC
jgi:hypothetical protein